MTPTEKLRNKLLKHLKHTNVSANQIKERKRANIYPIGTRAVYVFATQGKATDSHKWKMYEFFKALE